MKNPFKIFALVGVTTIAGFLLTAMVSAYEEGEAGKAVVEGKITFKGVPPPPKEFPYSKFPTPKFCSKVDSDAAGKNRLLHEVAVIEGALSDVVVYIRNITKGKPFKFNGTDVIIDHCRFLVQGGPSTFVGVVVKGAEIRILNDDADPSDPKSITGVLHNPHAYEMWGRKSLTLFNLPLPDKGGLLRKPLLLKRSDSIVKLEGDQNNFMNAYFYPVENPYYVIVGTDGTYAMDQVPAGKYKLIAWHPILGTQEKEIEVGATGKVTVNFEFSE